MEEKPSDIGKKQNKSLRVPLLLVLRILCRLSIWDAPITLLVLFLLIFFLLFTDKKLLWRPAKLPTLNLPLCWLDHNRRQAIFELTAAVKIRRVGEYLGGKTVVEYWLVTF